MFCVWNTSLVWCLPTHKNVQDVRIQCHADELILRNEPHVRTQRISTSKPLHAPCSAMRLMDDTRERCNQNNTYIMSCVWDHARAVMRQEPEQCFTVDILLHDSIRLKIMESNRSTSCRTHEIMRINECVVEHGTVQRVNQLFLMNSCFFHFVCSMILCDVV